MSKNLAQVYSDNPVATIAGTDLFYMAQSGTTDGAINGDDLLSAFTTGYTPDQIIVSSGIGSLSSVTMSGDGTFNTSSGVLTVSKVGNTVIGYSADTGAADAYIATLSPVPVSYTTGMAIELLVAHDNTGASTINVNGLGVKSIKTTAIAVLTAGQMKANMLAYLIYDGTQFQLINPIASGGGGGISNDGLNAAGQVVVSDSTTGALSVATFTYDVANFNMAYGGANPGSSGAQYNLAIGPFGVSIDNGYAFNLVFGLGCTVTAPSGNFCLVGGHNSTASGGSNVSWGTSCTASGDSAVSLGNGTSAIGTSSFAGGSSSSAKGSYSFAFGNSATAGDTFGGRDNAVAIGAGAQAPYSRCWALGNSATCGAGSSWAIGLHATTSHLGSMVIVDGQSSATGCTDDQNEQLALGFPGGYKWNIDNSDSTGTQAMRVTELGKHVTFLGTADQSYSLQAPSTGFAITISDNVKTLILNPAGTLLAGTVTMPAAPIDGQEIRICSDQTITTLTVAANSGQSMANAFATTLTAGAGLGYIYNLSATTWYRLY